MIETLVNVGASAAVTGVVQLLIWAAIQRSIERRDRQIEQLGADLQTLRDERVVSLEKTQIRDADKRGELYRRLEHMELNWVRKDDCIRMHQEWTASLLKLEGVSTETRRLLQWVADLNNQQIGLGNDLSGIAATVEGMKKR